MGTFSLESELEGSTTNIKLAELLQLNRQTEKAKGELLVALSSNIDRYFTNLVANENDREVKRELAAFMKAKNFEIIDEETLRFRAMDWSKAIYFEASIVELLAS